MNAGRVLVLEGVGKRYGTAEVVRDVHLHLARGESLALLGHNGAGKTTLIKIMLGLTRPSAGDVRVCGRRPWERGFSALRARIGYLPENVMFHDSMTGRELLAFYARLKGLPSRPVPELLERVGLGAAMDRRVRAYSKGMRQRLGLAQAMLGDPVLLLLDEPTTGLDPFLKRQFYELVAERRDGGTGVLLSSHALGEIEARTDRIAIMRGGRLVACGTLAELRRQAACPTRIRVRTAASAAEEVLATLAGLGEPRPLGPGNLEFACHNGTKMELLRRVSALGELIEDVEIVPPTLEDIYDRFSETAEPQ